MTHQNSVNVHFEDGFAVISIGDRQLTIARRDTEASGYLCPVELVSAALGS
jgi:hypothetical protein